MNKVFVSKLKESLLAVLPITFIILILNFSISPMAPLNTASFGIGAALLIFGMTLYSLGVDIAVEPIGEQIGSKISDSKKIPPLLLAVFLIGVIITIAEPDLTVLASQVSVNKWTLILVISLGIGLFMVIAVLRTLLKINLNIMFAALYGVIFVLVIFVDKNLVPLAFDSGGVTTGPITVPFIMTLGAGIGTVLGGGKSQEKSFGTIGICSAGPIMVVLILCLIDKTESYASVATLENYSDFTQVVIGYVKILPVYLKDVGIALAPITIFFFIMQFISIKLPAKRLLRICVGLLYTYLGLSVFLTGVNVGFMATGAYIGAKVAAVDKFLTIPIGMAIGACIVLAEPAIHVLNKQVEDITGGTISRKTMLASLAVSMSAALGLSMLRVATGLNILYILIPGYALSVLLAFFVPKIFTGIAFDSGGVASGPMTSTFVLPFAAGACAEVGGNILSDAFGTVGIVALTPLVTLQTLGLIYKLKLRSKTVTLRRQNAELLAREGEIIEFEI